MESLELGPPPPAPRQRQLLVLLGVAAVVVALLVFGIMNSSRQDSSTPAPSPSPGPTEQATPTRSPTPTATPPAVRRWSTGGFLSDLDLDLYVRAEDHLYRIQTATRSVTATTVPQLSGGALTFIVDGSTVIIRDWNGPAGGFVVSEGQLPQDLPSRLGRPDQVLPGPPGRLWLISYDGKPAAQLTDLTGHPVRVADGPSRYEDLDGLQSDGRGGLMLTGAGGTYAMTPDGPRRITRGTVLATGSSYLLTTDCTATLRCSRYLIDRRTGEQRRIGRAPVNDYTEGAVSPDGRYAALLSWRNSGETNLRVLDLRSNRQLHKLSDETGSSDPASLIWTSDGRLVGPRDNGLFVFDPATNTITTADLGLTGALQLRQRTG